MAALNFDCVRLCVRDGVKKSKWKGLASYCKAETTFTFYFTILPLSRAFLSIDNREMKSESGFSFVMASQPFEIESTLGHIIC